MYKKSKIIKDIRKLMESGVKYTAACERLVKTAQTIENWRNKHPRLDRYFLKLMDKRENKVVDAIENKLEDRLLKGEASSSEYFFYLCNKRPEKWKNRYQVDHSGKVEGFENKNIVVIFGNGQRKRDSDTVQELRATLEPTTSARE